MLFNSFIFILAFLPAFLLIYGVAERISVRAAIGVIGVGSLIFYAWWYPPNVVLLGSSIIVNYAIGKLMLSRRGRAATVMFWLGITFNVGLLAYYKYTYFVFELFGGGATVRSYLGEIALPLAISFFTFQQVSFLIDVRRGQIKKTDFLTYSAFVAFFPHLIAGPIVRYSELVPQFERRIARGPLKSSEWWRNLYVGGIVFTFGLAKKVIFADTLGEFVDPVFASASAGNNPGTITAWAATLAFAFQIYFDFSGYSDMAIGLSRLVGYSLPINFLSPYKATNISEFWRRWHITMTRFFTSTIFTPMTVILARKAGPALKNVWADFLLITVVPVSITFALIGLWHGAGWNFVLFGMAQAVFLVIHRFWSDRRFLNGRYSPGHRLSVALTFFSVATSMVLFRAESVSVAALIYENMFLPSHLIVPTGLANMLPAVGEFTRALGGTVGEVPHWQGTRTVVWLLMSAVVCFAYPNVLEIMRRYHPALPLGWRQKTVSVQRGWLSRAAFGASTIVFFAWIFMFFQLPPLIKYVPTSITVATVVPAAILLLALPRGSVRFEWRASVGQSALAGVFLAAVVLALVVGKEDAFIYFAF